MNIVRASIATFVAAAAAAGTSPLRAASAVPVPDPEASLLGETRTVGSASSAPGRAGPRPAPRVEELAGQLGLREVRDLRARAVADLNEAAAQTFGPFDHTKAAILGRHAYFADGDVDVFVIGRGPEDRTYVGVPLGTVVSEAGDVVLPAVDPNAYGAPLFDGPWGVSTTSFYTATNVDDGGSACGTTTARTTLRASWRRLDDHSASRDYWGVDLAALAEVTGTSGCNDFVDDARIGFRSAAPGAAVVAEEPVSGRTQSCSARTVSVGSSWGAVSASVGQTFTHCEKIGVTGALRPAATTRMLLFDNNGRCQAGDAPFDGRELAQVGVVQVPQGASHGLVLSFGVNAGNASTCKEDQC